jgi:acyl phosphate:glycerol-3-phosphate acyltransferase
MPRRRRALRSVLALAGGYLAGSVPFSQLVARRTRGVDLRRVGTGTVSGTSLYHEAGFGPLAVAGVADVAKGAVGPALAGRDRPGVAAAAGALAVAGHNWSPWLAGAGGRGISPAVGSMLPYNWPGAVVLLGGMAGGRIVRSTALGSLVADAALVPVLAATRGRPGRQAGTAVVVPLLVKRLWGNGRPQRRTATTYLWRLLFDRDTRYALPGSAIAQAPR